MRYSYYLEKAVQGEFSTAYEYSVPLIVSALQFNKLKIEYKVIRKNMMMKLFKEQNESDMNSYLAWLYGRVFYSSKLSGVPFEFLGMDTLHLDKAKKYTTEKTDNLDACDLWAKSYFAFDKSCYDSNRDLIFDSSRKLNDLVEKLWVHALLMNAAAEHADKSFYDKVKDEVRDITQEKLVHQGLKKIPLKDFQGWALSLSLLAEVKFNPNSEATKDIVNELIEITQGEENIHDISLIDGYIHYLTEKLSFKL